MEGRREGWREEGSDGGRKGWREEEEGWMEEGKEV